jgi:hypothetical protein
MREFDEGERDGSGHNGDHGSIEQGNSEHDRVEKESI